MLQRGKVNHETVAFPGETLGTRKMHKKLLFITLLGLVTLLFSQPAQAKNYSALLVKGLIKLGYPLTREDVLAIDKISMRFDSKNRIDVLSRILHDRKKIHAMEGGDRFEKIEVVCNALHLLDELDLPVTRRIVKELIKTGSWKTRELRLLSYMAAKRDIDVDDNVKYLIDSLPRQGTDLEEEWGGQISLAIMDICDNLSFLTELFVYRGDRSILDALIKYAEQTYGYPKEYLSHMFVEIFLQRPELFVTVLSEKEKRTAGLVINSLIFAIWNGDARGKVDVILNEELVGDEYNDNRMLTMFKEKLATYSNENEKSGSKKQAEH